MIPDLIRLGVALLRVTVTDEAGIANQVRGPDDLKERRAAIERYGRES